MEKPIELGMRCLEKRMPTVMVHLRLGRSNEELIRLTRELATKWDATIIGVAGYRRPIAPGRDLDVTGINAAERDLQEQLRTAEEEFLGALRTSGIDTEWRPTATSGGIAMCLVKQARATDLLVGAIEHASDTPDQVKIEDIIVDLGRPALLMPTPLDSSDLGNVLIGWTDTPEARRAVFDALPLLRRAKSISICTVFVKSDQEAACASVQDVVAWLKRNDVFAKLNPMLLDGDPASKLLIAANDQRAGVIIAGAFGHRRLREQVFGGVTKDLLEKSKTCLFLSH
jgi:nucleotide-binding universal stress UspA family protein